MDFARSVSFKNADIGRCAHQKPHEDEDGAVPAEIVIQPEPVPTPASPTPTPVLAHVSAYIPLRSNFYPAFSVIFRRKVIQDVKYTLLLELEQRYPVYENLFSLYLPCIAFISVSV